MAINPANRWIVGGKWHGGWRSEVGFVTTISGLLGIAVQTLIGAAIDETRAKRGTALTVLPPFHTFTTDTRMIEDTPDQYKIRMHEHAEKTLGTVVRAAQAAGVACEMVQVEHEHPYRAITDIAEAKRCDLIVMASHSRHSVSAIALGGETVKVLTHCKVPVRVHR